MTNTHEEVAAVAESILNRFWLSQVERVAKGILAERRDKGILLVPPTADQYVEAATTLILMLTDAPKTTLEMVK